MIVHTAAFSHVLAAWTWPPRGRMQQCMKGVVRIPLSLGFSVSIGYLGSYKESGTFQRYFPTSKANEQSTSTSAFDVEQNSEVPICVSSLQYLRSIVTRKVESEKLYLSTPSSPFRTRKATAFKFDIMTPQLSHEQRTRIIAQNAKAPQLTLPPEVWLIVLDCFQHLEDADDLIWLWLGGRHVCTQFRHKIDTLFASTHLPVTTLRCELGKIIP